MLRQAVFVIAAGLMALLPASAQQAPRRVALIIANATYGNYRPLPNTAVDAGLVEAALRRVGFEVQKQNDLGIGPMRTALGAFQTRATGADVALVYYAGHGMEAGGRNWLIPTDAQLSTDAELDFQAVEASLVIRATAGAKARIIVLDACRDNPFAARMRSVGVYRVTRATGGGLSALDVQSARGTLLMYSAASGEVADDGAPGRGSPFARAFAAYMPEPGVELRLAVGKVADAVYSETQERQLPFTTTSLSGSAIYLSPAAPVVVTDPETERLRRRIQELEQAQKMTPPVAPVTQPQPSTRGQPGTASQGSAPAVRVAGEVFRDCADCPDMVVIPGGTFAMGASPSDPSRETDEAPQHTVTVRAFAVSKFEVTFSQWDACVSAGGCGGYSPTDDGWGRGNQPVRKVSWNDAKAYVAWVNTRVAGRPYRLLTEAEWEYAARGRTSTPYLWGTDSNGGCAWGNAADASGKREVPTWTVSTCDDGVGQRSTTVGRYRANGFGLYDVIGNVREWVEDCYQTNYAQAPLDGSAVGGSCAERVYRGGSWSYVPTYLRTSKRGKGAPASRDSMGGIRIARTL